MTFALFALFRSAYGALGCATPSATQAYLASKTRRSGRVVAAVGTCLLLFVGDDHRPRASRRCSCFRSSACRDRCSPSPLIGARGAHRNLASACPTTAAGAASGRGAAMSYPSLASPPTGASVVAATSPRRMRRLKWNDPRIRPWIIAGVISGHAQAAALTSLGFFVIDRLALEPSRAEGPISIVMMAGAAATLAAQWGLIPRLSLGPRALILWGSIIAAAGLVMTRRLKRPLRHHVGISRSRASASA